MTAVVLRGDARALPLPDSCVDLIVTSPPFWQLRSYTDNGVHYDGQIGSERTPREYIDSLLTCTREWVRVLKPSGSLFVELGDKYAQPGKGERNMQGVGGTIVHKVGVSQANRSALDASYGGLPGKCLMGLPWRYAIRCIDELGLILRAEIAWHHVNGLPESVTDRVRRAHSTVFHFTVQPRYYAAVDEIREPHTMRPQRRPNGRPEDLTPRQGQPKQTWPTAQRDEVGVDGHPLGKLPGSVWNIPSQPLTVPAALGVDHFAAWPMELPRRIIRGWSPPGVCTACGEGRRPVTDRAAVPHWKGGRVGTTLRGDLRGMQFGNGASRFNYEATITGYACACPEPDAPVRPALVVDPFGGTGTTALVASMYGRTGLSFDLSADYCRLARWRTRDPAERARALEVPKPPPVPDGQGSLFDGTEAV